VGTDVFVSHGDSELYLHGTWRKATPAFNAELCERSGVPPLTFDGSADALLHPFAADGSAYMQYIRDRGVYVDPLEAILEVSATAYPGTPSLIGEAIELSKRSAYRELTAA